MARLKGQKTYKMLDVSCEGINFICIKAVHADRNKYRLFKRWYENGSWHRQKVEYYANFISVLCYLREYGFDHHWGFNED